MKGDERGRNESLPTERGRYGSFSLADGDVVVFDRRDPDIWVRSSVVVDVEQ